VLRTVTWKAENKVEKQEMSINYYWYCERLKVGGGFFNRIVQHLRREVNTDSPEIPEKKASLLGSQGNGNLIGGNVSQETDIRDWRNADPPATNDGEPRITFVEREKAQNLSNSTASSSILRRTEQHPV